VAEQPVEDRAVPVRIPPADQPPPLYYYHFTPPRPKVVVKADLLPAVAVVGTIALFAMPLAWIWERLAPAQNKVVQEGGKLVAVGGESYHRLDDLMLFVVLGLGAGLLTGIAVWLLRQRRGPVIMLAATAGSGVAAYLAQMTGEGWAADRYAIAVAPQVGDMIAVAPMLESAWGVLAWPLGTALAYGCLAAWNGLDDLGRRLG